MKKTNWIILSFIISLFIFIAPGQSKEVQSYKEECELSIKQVKAIGFKLTHVATKKDVISLFFQKGNDVYQFDGWRGTDGYSCYVLTNEWQNTQSQAE